MTIQIEGGKIAIQSLRAINWQREDFQLVNGIPKNLALSTVFKTDHSWVKLWKKSLLCHSPLKTSDGRHGSLE